MTIISPIKRALRAAAPSAFERLSRLRGALSVFRAAHALKPEDIPGVVATIKSWSGHEPRECPICGYAGAFRAFGSPPRWDAQCSSCGSLERHRLLALTLRKTDLIARNSRVLHFAPEPSVASLVRGRVAQYVAADLNPQGVDVALNIEDIDIQDDAFDVVICSHVLDAVDDCRALSELRRILTPGGLLILMVPIAEGCAATFEFPTTPAPSADPRFSRDLHLRLYGADLRGRLAAAGFRTTEHTAFGDEALRYGLVMGEKIFLCTVTSKSPKEMH
jgi:SAM-dependent methyltransferase